MPPVKKSRKKKGIPVVDASASEGETTVRRVIAPEGPGPSPFALVTGASSGIGEALARRLARAGHPLVLVARNRQKLEALSESITRSTGLPAIVLAEDLAESKAPERLARELERRRIRVGILVNNAGFGSLGPFEKAAWIESEDMIHLNIRAVTELTWLLLPQMRALGSGRILNVASTAAFQPGPGMAVYCATKSFVLSWSEAVGEELRGTGITVTALCPGATESAFADRAGSRHTPIFRARIPTSDEVAAFGMKALFAGRPVAIHGFKNALLARLGAFVPRALVLRLSARLIGGGT